MSLTATVPALARFGVGSVEAASSTSAGACSAPMANAIAVSVASSASDACGAAGSFLFGVVFEAVNGFDPGPDCGLELGVLLTTGDGTRPSIVPSEAWPPPLRPVASRVGRSSRFARARTVDKVTFLMVLASERPNSTDAAEPSRLAKMPTSCSSSTYT